MITDPDPHAGVVVLLGSRFLSHTTRSYGASLFTSTNNYSTQTLGRGRPTLTPPPPPPIFITQAFKAHCVSVEWGAVHEDVLAGSSARSSVGGRTESVVDDSGTASWRKEGSCVALVVLLRRLCEGVVANEAGHDGGTTMPSAVKMMSRQGIVLVIVRVDLSLSLIG